MTTLRNTIEDLSSQFANSIIEALRGASIDELLDVAHGGPRPRAREMGESVAPPRRVQGARRGRRTAGDIADMVDSIVELLQNNPNGLRSEQIREQLGVEAKELPRPLADAMEQNLITKTGQKRATTYFVASGDIAMDKRRIRKPNLIRRNKRM
ncbi:MAG: hypothetical protein FWD73_10300 [Polyangiaceae bacterium]|nr:hypothetical protein [Polyangiaceae bacterium]